MANPRDLKTEAAYRAAQIIIEEQTAARDAKTAKLRKARLAKEASEK